MHVCTPEHPLKIAVLLSGNGSNLQAIIDTITNGLPVEICVVLSDKKDAYGLERARRAEIPTEILVQKTSWTKDTYDKALSDCLDTYQPQLIVLAGFMRILTSNFVNHFKNRIVNIHPSLLPKYPGLNTHKKVLFAKDKQHGATVHVVIPKLDRGPIIMQASLPVSPEDDEHSLKHKIHALEHKLYPEVIQLYAEGHLEFKENSVWLDDEKLPPEGLTFRMHY